MHVSELVLFLREGLAAAATVEQELPGSAVSSRTAADSCSAHARRCRFVWLAAGGGDEGGAGHGLARAATALTEVESALQELRLRFQKLQEDFVCLDDGDAEKLFGAHGELCSAAALAERSAQNCKRVAVALTQPLPQWLSSLPDPEPIAASLEAGASAIVQFLNLASELAARRQAAVARAKAAVEVRAAAEASSAHGILAEALGHRRRVDFPTVTEICEGCVGNDKETALVVRLLSSSLQDKSADTSRQLKALTVANELLYSEVARRALLSEPGLLETLRRLRSSSLSASGSSEKIAEGTARMLACELERRLILEKQLPPPKKRISISGWLRGIDAPSWPSHSKARPSGAAWAESRDAAEALTAKLRQRPRVRPPSRTLDVLDSVHRRIDIVACDLKHVMSHDLDEGVAAAAHDDVQNLAATYLQAVVDVQNRSLQWKCTLVAWSKDLNDGVALRDPRSRECSLLSLAEFLEKAISIGNGLDACLSALAARQEEEARDVAKSSAG